MRPFATLCLVLLFGCDPGADDDKILAVDADEDGLVGSDDCDDDNANVGGEQTWVVDADGDTFGGTSVVSCVQPDGAVDGSTDCDDASAGVNPLAAEVCDGIDNNCDGTVDEGAGTTFYADSDSDGFGDATVAQVACELPDGFVANAEDCDDRTALIFPGAVELCNEVDDDCDALVDNDTTTDAAWYADNDYDGYGDPADVLVSCKVQPDRVLDGDDCDDTDRQVNPGEDETCNTIDDDCDGSIDEEYAIDEITWYEDADADGYGQGTPLDACEQPENYAFYDGDCNDADSAVHPGASEADCADPTDYNCDGSVAYADADADGWAACTECDDASAANFPGATEYCDGSDNDCDGTIDEADAVDVATWYADVDADYFGDASAPILACNEPIGHVSDATDCDDLDGNVNPDATEVCNGVDDDCDTEIDEESAADAEDWYADSDGDGYGDLASTVHSCEAPAGFVSDHSDCDDARNLTHPGATEYCNTGDDDCDGDIDEAAVDARTFWADDDGDTYGDASVWVESCSTPVGYVRDDDDCDDTDPAVNPLASESCNSEDDNCNGLVDDGLPVETWYEDADSDDFGGLAQTGCGAPPDAVTNQWDCNDLDPSIYPGSDVTCPWSSCLDLLDDGIATATDEYWIDFDGTSTLTTCDMDYDGGGWTLLFEDNFNSGADSAWSMRSTYNCGEWGPMLGGYGIIAGGTVSVDVSTYAIAHTQAWAELDYIALDSWDGETAYINIDGTRVWTDSQNNHSSTYSEVCGWNRGYYGSFDSKEAVGAVATQSDSTITLVGGSTLDQGATDESFGLDNVFVWIR